MTMENGLYVHIPFCASRCHYCDFASTAGLPRAWQERYRAALRIEMALLRDAPEMAMLLGEPDASASGSLAYADVRAALDGAPGTVYIGGGTPTYLEADILEGVLSDIAEAYLVPGAYRVSPIDRASKAPGTRMAQTEAQAQALAARQLQPKEARPAPTEYTVEANPGTLTPEKLAILRAAGGNRLSIGAQSFDDRRLAWLGRAHSASAFHDAWAAARVAGFANMSLDLMYGLPGQSPGEWRRTLLEALDYEPEHISLYQLNIEPGTALARLEAESGGVPYTADEETCRAHYLLAHHVLTEAGYLHYEISNYAKPGYESRHNTLYWRGGHYLGLGAGASGHVPGRRYTNKADVAAYMADLEAGARPVADDEEITMDIAMAEEMMLAFRLHEGVDKARYRARWGLAPEQRYGEALARLIDAGALTDDGRRLSPTPEGWLSYNAWILDFL